MFWTKEKTKLYTSLEVLPIWNFYEIINSADKKHLLIEGKETEDKLEELWFDLYNDYFEKSGIKAPDYKTIIKIKQLIVKHDTIARLLGIVLKYDRNQEAAIEKLKEFGYLIRKDKSLLEEVKRLGVGLESLRTRISLEESKIEKPKKQANLNIYKDKILLQKYFKFDIDVKTMPCLEWIELNKNYKEASKNRK